MDEKPLSNCPVQNALRLIGGKHKTLILWHLSNQTLRFGQLQAMIPEVGSKMLSQQLKALEADGLVSRKVFAEIPPRVEYSLTELGLALQPTLQALFDWGSRYMATQGLKPSCSMTATPKLKQRNPEIQP